VLNDPIVSDLVAVNESRDIEKIKKAITAVAMSGNNLEAF